MRNWHFKVENSKQKQTNKIWKFSKFFLSFSKNFLAVFWTPLINDHGEDVWNSKLPRFLPKQFQNFRKKLKFSKKKIKFLKKKLKFSKKKIEIFKKIWNFWNFQILRIFYYWKFWSKLNEKNEFFLSNFFEKFLGHFFGHPKFLSMVEIDIGGADVTFRCQILSKHEKMCQILVANGTHHLYTYQNHVI